jgi:hypothetical protein
MPKPTTTLEWTEYDGTPETLPGNPPEPKPWEPRRTHWALVWGKPYIAQTPPGFFLREVFNIELTKGDRWARLPESLDENGDNRWAFPPDSLDQNEKERTCSIMDKRTSS